MVLFHTEVPMPVQLFTEAERARRNRFSDVITYEDLVTFFTLSERDRRSIPRSREPHNRLGYEQLLLNSRRTRRPAKRRDRALWRRHAHASRARVKVLQIGHPPSGAAPGLPHAPKACHGLEGGPPRGGQHGPRPGACQWASGAARVGARWRPRRSAPPRPPSGPVGPKRARLGWRDCRNPAVANGGPTLAQPFAVPDGTASRTLSNTPRGTRRPRRSRPPAWRWSPSARVRGLALSGRGGRRYR
jgi:Domain of unknown function (DUF4158)